MVPGSIISGFKVCGVYPFNPKAVLDHVHFLNRKFNKNNNTSEQEHSEDQRVTLECEDNVNEMQ